MAGLSNHYDSMVAIKALIEAASLTGLSATGVLIQEVAWHEKDVTTTVLPFISISPYGAESSDDWMVQEDYTGYPILVAIIAAKSTSALEARLEWRQKILRRLRNRSLTGLAANHNLTPRPLDVVSQAAYWGKNLFVSGIVVTCSFAAGRT